MLGRLSHHWQVTMVTMVHPDDAAKISPKIHMEIGNPWKSSRIFERFFMEKIIQKTLVQIPCPNSLE